MNKEHGTVILGLGSCVFLFFFAEVRRQLSAHFANGMLMLAQLGTRNRSNQLACYYCQLVVINAGKGRTVMI